MHRRALVGGTLVLCGVLLATALYPTDTPNTASLNTPAPVRVTVASVAALSESGTPLTALGEVRSASQAELRAQKTAEVTGVHVRAGQYIAAGTVLAELENAQERAAVLSAEGILAAAKAARDRTRSGDRAEDKASIAAQAAGAEIALTTAEDAARTAYTQAYTLAQDALYAKADTFFSNPYTVRPSFRVRSASYDEGEALTRERVALGTLFNTWNTHAAGAVPTPEIEARLTEAASTLERLKTYLDTISSFVSEQKLTDELTASDKAAQEASLFAARNAVDTAQSVVNGARTGLANARTGAVTAGMANAKSAAGARPEDLAAADAALTQASGALAGARAALERTIIRAPIAGTVTTLNATRGDFVNALTIVAVVANEHALEIELFVSDATRERLAVGMPALVDGRYTGTITSVAPGLDPDTKQARVTVYVPGTHTLVNGAYVEVAFSTSPSKEVARAATSSEALLPISAIKVVPEGLVVFTVDDGNTLVAHPIPEGTIEGDRMRVRSGLTPDMRIVTDVRGLSAGDSVDAVPAS